MKNYKVILAYDGGRYNGWQKQGNTENTIQARLERIVSEIAGAETEVFGSGRTDAGTHATGQAANFHIDWQGTPEELLSTLNSRLPEDIAGLSIAEVPPRFHSRLNAKAKTYVYTIWNSEQPPVFLRKYAFWCKKPLDREKMEEAAKAFLGEHDFKAFCANKRMKKTTVRRIDAIRFLYDSEKTEIHFTGNGFLYQMVRILTGTLIEVGEGRRQPEDMTAVLQAESREAAGFTAPSHGLCLREVYYH